MITAGNEVAQMSWNVKPFYNEWRRVKQRSNTAGPYFVKFQAKKLVRVAALNTPVATESSRMRGRARAGWWPAAAVLGLRSVYSPLPNLGEGHAFDGTANVANPVFRMTNSVPYITTMTAHGLAWWHSAVAQVESELKAYLEKLWTGVMRGGSTRL